MIQNLKNTGGHFFQLRANDARDGIFKATKAAMRKSIQNAVKYGEGSKYLTIKRYIDSLGYVGQTTVSVSYRRSLLRLGCHSFNRSTSAKILKWAGVKK